MFSKTQGEGKGKKERREDKRNKGKKNERNFHLKCLIYKEERERKLAIDGPTLKTHFSLTFSSQIGRKQIGGLPFLSSTLIHLNQTIDFISFLSLFPPTIIFNKITKSKSKCDFILSFIIIIIFCFC